MDRAPRTKARTKTRHGNGLGGVVRVLSGLSCPSAEIFLTLNGQVRKFRILVNCYWQRVRNGAACPSSRGHVMRLSSILVAPSAVAILSTILLCGPAASQTAPGVAAPLPAVTIEAPKHVAKPHHAKQASNTVASRRTSAGTHRTSVTAQTSTGQTASGAPEAPLARAARLAAVASNCNGGCESSLPHGNLPWVGCSESGGGQTTGPFSTTCRDNLTYKSYQDCVETKWFLGEYRNRAWWLCSSLQASGKFEVAELKRSRRAR